MLINLFIQDDRYKFNYDKIEKYTNIFLLFFSLFTTINLYFDYNYSFIISFIKYYLFSELLFLPWHKKDLIIHHIITILHSIYIEYYNINLTTNFYSSKQTLLTEISSIFLSLYSLTNTYITTNTFASPGIKHILKQIFMMCFILSFIKYRIYDYYNNVINNAYFYESLKTNDSNFQIISKYTLTYSLFALNLYWLTLIVKKIYKQCFNFSTLQSEYILQYSYFACLLSTCCTYTIFATPFQKEYYSSYITLDVGSNFLLSLTSHEFHKYIYSNLLIDKNMNRATTEYKNYLLQDIIVLQGRALTQVYCHFNIHDIFDIYKNIFYFQIFYSLILCLNVNSMYQNMITNKQLLPIDEFNSSSNYLDLLLGSNALICILLSSIGAYGTTDSINNIIFSYLIVLITILKPFYKINHLMVHVMMFFLNYYIVKNNLYLKN